MNRNISSIIDGLHGKIVSSYGTVNESGDYKTIAGIRAKVDKDGKVIDEKAKKLIEKRLGKSIDEATKEDETEKEIDEDEWKTMHGAHILVDDKGGIKAGGPENMRKKASKEEIKKGVEDANKKSEAKSKKDSKKSNDNMETLLDKASKAKGTEERKEAARGVTDKVIKDLGYTREELQKAVEKIRKHRPSTYDTNDMNGHTTASEMESFLNGTDRWVKDDTFDMKDGTYIGKFDWNKGEKIQTESYDKRVKDVIEKAVKYANSYCRFD